MLQSVRTVVDLEGRIWRKAREVAFRRRVSLSFLANLALRDYLGLTFEVQPKRPGRPRRSKAPKKGGSR
jgi:hypothetical protein